MDKESNERGESQGRENMMGRALRWKAFFWEEDFILGGGSILEGDGSTGLMACFVFLVLWESFLDYEYHCRGHRVARGFGHRGQDSFRFPGARELDMLLLVGWVDSRFGQCWSVHRARQGKTTTSQQGRDSHIDGN